MNSTETSSHHKLEETERKYKWYIKNFSSLSDKLGVVIKSQTYSDGTIEYNHNLIWQVTLFLNGFCGNSKGYISVELKNGDLTAPAFFEITAYSNVKVYITQLLYMTPDITDGISYTKLSNFIQHRVLSANIETNDSLTIAITEKNFFNFLPKKVSQNNLLNDFALLLEMGQNSDIILISSDGIKHKAHKAILMCRSKVFSAMFCHNMKENQNNEVKIDDINSETLKAVLQYLYTGDFTSIRETVIDLILAANKYQLDDLKGMCIEYLLRRIKCDNVLVLIDFANYYNLQELKDKSKKFFFQYHKEVKSLEGFNKNLQDLSRNTLEDLFCDGMDKYK